MKRAIKAAEGDRIKNVFLFEYIEETRVMFYVEQEDGDLYEANKIAEKAIKDKYLYDEMMREHSQVIDEKLDYTGKQKEIDPGFSVFPVIDAEIVNRNEE